jgi:hypothetical protein
MDLDNASVPFYLGAANQVGLNGPDFQAKYKRESQKEFDEDTKAASMAGENSVLSGPAHTLERAGILEERSDARLC